MITHNLKIAEETNAETGNPILEFRYQVGMQVEVEYWVREAHYNLDTWANRVAEFGGDLMKNGTFISLTRIKD